MSTKRLPWIALIAVALLAAGCASGGAAAPAGPPPEEVIAQMVTKAMELLAAGDVDNLMAMYSDDFTSDQGMDKAGMTGFLTGARDQGFLEGFTANTDAMVVTVDGATASVTGVAVEGAFGVLNLGFGLENRDGAWVITSQTQQ
ncbi:MAG TPA: hypothetical protein VMV46_08335 [Thermoanaerobaculia bacterium]|nr:hypothetical protein [Thermoanaerobaculia bacterium]